MIWHSALLWRLVHALGNIPKLKRLVRRILLNRIASSSEVRKNNSRHKPGGVLKAFFLITRKQGVANNRRPPGNLPAFGRQLSLDSSLHPSRHESHRC